MARDKRKLNLPCQQWVRDTYSLTYLGPKFAIMDVKVCATDSRGLNFNLSKLLDSKMRAMFVATYQDIMRSNYWQILLNDAELSSFTVLYKQFTFLS